MIHKIFSFLFLLLISFFANAKTTTVMIYWAVDNDLYKFSIPYLNQFKSIPSSDKLNLFLEYDYPGNRKTERYLNFKLIEKLSERNSAHPSTLSDFVKYGATHFPADESVLIIASHGSNWSGVIEDRTSNAYMSLSNLRKALLSSVEFLPKKKFDLIIFDACRMSYLETLFMVGDLSKLILGSSFDVNGFNHQKPLKDHVLKDQSLLETAKTYVAVYPSFPGNREYTDMGASLLKSMETWDLLPLAKLFNFLNSKSNEEIAYFLKKQFYFGEKDDDWGFDLIRLIKSSGEVFPEFMDEALFLNTYFSPIVLASSVTPGTRFHEGLGLTCASELSLYKKFPISQEIPEWVKLCKRLRDNSF